MADGLITYEEATGASPLPPSASSAPASAPSPSDAVAADPGDVAPPLTVSPRASTPPAAAPAGAAPSSASVPGLISYEDAVTPNTPNPGGVLSNASDDSYLTGALKGLGTAAVKAAGDVIGFPTALHGMADYLIARAESKITGQPVGSVLADLAAKKAALPAIVQATDPENVIPAPAAISAPILKQTGQYVPTTEPGKIAQAGAEAALSTLGPGVGSATAPASVILKAAPAMALGNAAAGATGQAVTDVTGDPLLGMGAGFVGGAAAGAGAAGLKKVGGPALMGTPGIENVPILGSRVAAARDNAAAGAILKQSSDPAALRDWSAQPAAPSDVPNSPQTTAGALGTDPGLFQAEKDARNVNNIPFNAVDRAQSGAQQAAITAAQPVGDVFRPGQVIGQRLDAIDAAAQTVEDRLNAAHQDAVAGRAQANQQTQDNLVQAFQDAHAQAAQAATDASAPLRALPTPEQTGAVLRTAQQEAKTAAKQAKDALYRAVDPDGTLATVVTPLKAAKNAIKDRIDPLTGVQPSGSEAKLWSDIDRLPDVIPFKSLQNLDSRVTAAMADARRNPNPDDPQALGRLTALKSAVMSTIHDGIENQAAHEARLVDAGVMPAEDAMEARIANALQRKVDAFYADRQSRVASGSEGDGPDPRVGASRSFGVSRAGGSARSKSGADQSVEGIPPSPLAPNFDAAASERLAAAKAAHADYAQIYKNSAVAPILDTNGFVGQYKLPNGAVPSSAIVMGGKGFETANAFLRAANNETRAISAMQDAAADPLRKFMPPTGTLHPNALAKWKENYGGALRALDAVSLGFSGRFDNAANATQALLDLGIRQKRALAEHQSQAAAEALAANQSSLASTRQGIADARSISRQAHASPAGQFAAAAGNRVAATEVENAVGGMLKTGTAGATRMRSLVATVAQDDDALAGLRKAGVDWMVRNFQNADGTLAGAKFIDFIRGNRDTLKELYPTGQVSMFGAVARDAEVNARWRTQTAIKGGSDSAKNLLPHLQEAAHQSGQHTSMMVIAAEAMREGYERGGVGGAVAAGGGAATLFLMNSLRSAGLKSVAELYREALLDPEKARYLISKMPAASDGGKLRALTGALRRELIVGPQIVRDRPHQ